MAKRRMEQPPLESREFMSAQEIDAAISRLERRVRELEELDVRAAVEQDTGADRVAKSNIRATIHEVFGANSPEFNEHRHLDFWTGPLYVNMPQSQIIEAKKRGVRLAIGILTGLIGRLREKRDDFAVAAAPSPATYIDRVNLHPRILAVSSDLFRDGYPWEAVFAAAKALVNYIKERSGRYDLDGAPLARAVFSRNDPILAFNDRADQTDLDEQEGMMHLFEGAVLGIRNPGGHAFPEGPEQRAIEYLSLLSLLGYRVQEAKRLKIP
jgi:uncharacterized protein (TIGR02391 family)